ncbi:hypothetical protein C8F04DRAFT_1191038 [Mycena alexandri]|uniref:Uncharacterized protein n=1 Tax=Mycena alexandri TaxID=1745969 RepID=A0AAD6SDY1_9AGAR|nr:hypothetical protein C8F04DRAFT_1191038 [Mycena alexandri]
MNIITTLLALTAMCMGKPASIVVRNDPYASITISVNGIYQPKSTDPAVVAAYAQTAQTCGPDEDAALQTLFSSGQYQSDTGDTRDNITVTDLAFQTWAIQQPTWTTVKLRCDSEQDHLAALEYSVKQASPTSTAQESRQSRAPSGTSTLTESPTASDATKSGLPGGGVVHRSQPVAFITLTDCAAGLLMKSEDKSWMELQGVTAACILQVLEGNEARDAGRT